MGYQGHQRGACGGPDWTKIETGLERLQDWIIKLKHTVESRAAESWRHCGRCDGWAGCHGTRVNTTHPSTPGTGTRVSPTQPRPSLSISSISSSVSSIPRSRNLITRIVFFFCLPPFHLTPFIPSSPFQSPQLPDRSYQTPSYQFLPADSRSHHLTTRIFYQVAPFLPFHPR